MKTKIFSLFIALVATMAVNAQQIAVVSKGGVTNIYQTLGEAIAGAADGSVVYLPGGSFPIGDDVKITKSLNIIGIGHNSQSGNADGRTHIAGNLFFNAGSDGSAVMGCYINGNVNVGTSDAPVHRVVVKYCNVNSIQVNNGNCLETFINQNYIRNVSNCNYAKVDFTNNIMHSLQKMNGGKLSYNVFTSRWDYQNCTMYDCNNCVIEYNVILDNYWVHKGNNCQATGNMLQGSWGSESIKAGGWGDVFENSAGVSVNSSYHFKEAYAEYEGQIGIYGGTGFSETALPPVPYIFLKSIPDKTDASGKLHISIGVKASE